MLIRSPTGSTFGPERENFCRGRGGLGLWLQILVQFSIGGVITLLPSGAITAKSEAERVMQHQRVPGIEDGKAAFDSGNESKISLSREKASAALNQQSDPVCRIP